MARTLTPLRWRSIVWGLCKWLPFLVMPFAVLFVETWIQLHIYQNDYQTNHLTQENRRLQNEIKDMEARKAELEAMRRLVTEAPQLGLVEPEQGQVRIITVLDDRPNNTPAAREAPLALAQQQEE